MQEDDIWQIALSIMSFFAYAKARTAQLHNQRKYAQDELEK